MRSKFSRIGKSSAVTLTLVTSRSSGSQDDATATKEQMSPSFGKWSKETGMEMGRMNQPTAFDVWRQSQAASYLKRPCTVAEANELWSRIDITTRQPIASDAPAPSRFARALQALRLAVGSILLGMGLSACTGESVQGSIAVRKTFDAETGVVCYYLNGQYGGISCVQVKEGTKP